MPTHSNRFATLRPFLQQIDPASSGGITPAVADPAKPDDAPLGDAPLGDAGKAALDAEREARRLSDRRAKDAETKLAAFESAKVKAEEDAQAAQGEWKTLAERRDADLKAATTNLDSLKATNDALSAYFDGHYTAALKDLPDVIKAFAPADDATFATKADWLTKAQVQAAKIAKDNATPGNGPNPKPASGAFDLDAAVAAAKRSGTYRT